MNFKRLLFAIQEKDTRNLDLAKDYPTIADLMKAQQISTNDTNTVHRRRDLDSLG